MDIGQENSPQDNMDNYDDAARDVDATQFMQSKLMGNIYAYNGEIMEPVLSHMGWTEHDLFDDYPISKINHIKK